MRIYMAAFLSLTLCVAVAARAEDPKLETQEQKTIYALGLVIAQSLERYNLAKDELPVLEAGIEDGVMKREPKVDVSDYRLEVQKLGQARGTQLAEVEKKESAAFLAKVASENGAKKTGSGLVYKEIVPGTGASPKTTDTVKVHYHGTLRDGKVFDSSVDRGTPATFPLNRVIPCWTEGLQMMKVGGKSRLTCPSDIAYGDRGSPPTIKPGATLVFDVELLEITQ